MEYSWFINLYDEDGDKYEDGIFVFCGNDTILKFKNVAEVELFATDMLKSIFEINNRIGGSNEK